MISKFILLLLFHAYSCLRPKHGYVVLQNDGPAIRGANVTFTATLRDHNRNIGNLKTFAFRNLDLPEEYAEINSTKITVNHTVELSRSRYQAGEHTFEVRVYSERTRFQPGRSRVILTDLLNGDLIHYQNGIERSNGYVFVNETVNHVIRIPDKDLEFVTRFSSYSVLWFLNCTLIGVTKEFSFKHVYLNEYRNYNLEVLVVIEKEPLSTDESTSGGTTVLPESTPKHVTEAKNEIRYSDRGVINGYDKLLNFNCPYSYRNENTLGYYKQTIHVQGRDSSTQLDTSSNSASITSETTTWRSSASYQWTTTDRPWHTSAAAAWAKPRTWRTPSSWHGYPTSRDQWGTRRPSYPWRTTFRPWPTSNWLPTRTWYTFPTTTSTTTESYTGRPTDRWSTTNINWNNTAATTVLFKMLMDMQVHGSINVTITQL